MKLNWNYPTIIWIGENRIDDLGEACKSSNINNPLFVTDKHLIELPMTQKIINFKPKGKITKFKLSIDSKKDLKNILKHYDKKKFENFKVQ